jgi:hypothetical protein
MVGPHPPEWSDDPRLVVLGAENAALEELRELVDADDLRLEPGELLPSQPLEGPCRICGRVAMLTEEHIPPRGAYNRGRGRTPNVRDQLGNDELDPPDSGPFFQGGISGYVLCEPCNNTTGTRWARAYQDFAQRGVALLSGVPGGIAAVATQAGYPGWDEIIFKDVYPGRYVRQVISMMLGISGDASLSERFPELRRLALGGDPEPLTAPLRLYMQVFGGPAARYVGGPSGALWVDLSSRTKRRVLQIDHPPLGHVLLVDGPPAEGLGIDISSLTEHEVDRKAHLTFEGMPLGFAYKPWPTDYRSRGQIIAERGDDRLG